MADEYEDFVYLETSLKMPQQIEALKVLIPLTNVMNGGEFLFDSPSGSLCSCAENEPALGIILKTKTNSGRLPLRILGSAHIHP